MHNQEENGVAVTTVTSNKISKERGKTMKNEKTSLNIRKLKKQVKGITLIALVVTIIVLLILAGVAISLTVGDNGLFRRAQNAADTWQMAEQNEQSEMEQAGDFIDAYANNITRVDGVPIPDGFYYVGGEKDSGIIISDSLDDENKGVDYPTSSFKGNQFVWVPVSNPEKYFIDETATLNTKATGTEEENEVTTNVYSNLTIRNEDQNSYIAGIPGVEISEDGKDVTREPDVLSSYDTQEQYYKNILGFDSTKAMAESFVAEYKAMSDSIKKYKGFYIGRYELTANGEKTGASLTDQNWYNLYKACQNVVTGKENVKSTMIYGVQWDAVCDWLKQSGFDTDADSSSWGNYSNSSENADVNGAGSKQNTGYSEYWKANNIYDLAGNYLEWTQEANSTVYRVMRGGNYGLSGSNYPASYRRNGDPYNADTNSSSRATLYIM